MTLVPEKSSPSTVALTSHPGSKQTTVNTSKVVTNSQTPSTPTTDTWPALTDSPSTEERTLVAETSSATTFNESGIHLIWGLDNVRPILEFQYGIWHSCMTWKQRQGKCHLPNCHAKL